MNLNTLFDIADNVAATSVGPQEPTIASTEDLPTVSQANGTTPVIIAVEPEVVPDAEIAIAEDSDEELNVGDTVFITGNVQFSGETGKVVDFGRDKNFVVVELDNHGKHIFHSSNVEFNDYADREDEYQELDEVDLGQIANTASNAWTVWNFIKQHGIPVGLFAAAVGTHGLANAMRMAQQDEGRFKAVAKKAATKINPDKLESLTDKLNNWFVKTASKMKLDNPHEMAADLAGIGESNWTLQPVVGEGMNKLQQRRKDQAIKMMESNGDTNMDRWMQEYDEREDNNYHTENAVAVAELVGDDEQKQIMRDIQTRHKQRGSISQADQMLRSKLLKILWPKVEARKKLWQSKLNELYFDNGSSQGIGAWNAPITNEDSAQSKRDALMMAAAVPNTRNVEMARASGAKDAEIAHFMKLQGVDSKIIGKLVGQIGKTGEKINELSKDTLQSYQDKIRSRPSDQNSMKNVVGMARASERLAGHKPTSKAKPTDVHERSKSAMTQAISELSSDTLKSYRDKGDSDIKSRMKATPSTQNDKKLSNRLRGWGQASSRLGEDGGYNSQYKSKSDAIQAAREQVKQFRDPDDHIEVWELPDGGFDLVANMNWNGRDHVIKNGGKKLGVIKKQGVAEGEESIEDLQKQRQSILNRCKHWAASQDGSYEMALDAAGFNDIEKKISNLKKQQGLAEGSESQDKLVSMLNSFDYYSDNSKVYVNDAGDKIARQGSNWKHQSGKVGNGPEELGNFLSSNQGVAEGVWGSIKGVAKDLGRDSVQKMAKKAWEVTYWPKFVKPALDRITINGTPFSQMIEGEPSVVENDRSSRSLLKQYTVDLVFPVNSKVWYQEGALAQLERGLKQIEKQPGNEDKIVSFDSPLLSYKYSKTDKQDLVIPVRVSSLETNTDSVRGQGVAEGLGAYDNDKGIRHTRESLVAKLESLPKGDDDFEWNRIQAIQHLKQGNPLRARYYMAKMKRGEQGVAEGSEQTINIGDDVVIIGNSAYAGVTGRVIGFREGKIVVDMLEQGKVRFAPERVKLYTPDDQGVAEGWGAEKQQRDLDAANKVRRQEYAEVIERHKDDPEFLDYLRMFLINGWGGYRAEKGAEEWIAQGKPLPDWFVKMKAEKPELVNTIFDRL